MEKAPEAITFFIHPGSLEELEKRLRDRQTDTSDSIERRLEVARRELDLKHLYQHEIVNDDLDRAVGQLCDILEAT